MKTGTLVNSTEYWDIINLTPNAVPIHLHNTHFKVRVGPKPLKPWSNKRKTWQQNSNAGMVVRFLFRARINT